MQPTILAAFFEISFTVASMCGAGILLLLIGLLAARNDIGDADGLDKVVALANLCFAAPLAVFGAEHFGEAKSIMQGVPAYMPWRLFWTYFVGVALLAASLSIATKIQVRWSGLLWGIMMFLFVAMMDVPGTLARHGDRISVTLLLRELSFGGAGWILAGSAMGGRGAGKALIAVGRVILGISAIFYGVEHFLHPLGLPGVPLMKLMPTWVPGRALIDYVTGAFLLISGVCILLNKKTRTAATYLGSWILLMVVVIYGPVLIGALLDTSTGVKIEGLNYFFDTLLYAGAILALAGAAQGSESTARQRAYSSDQLERPVA
jgi:uncharacterized membrane protein